jgi:hypothetical protein
MDRVAVSIPLANRPGVFAILTPAAGERVKYMKLYATSSGGVVAETITRTRRPLTDYDEDYRLAIFGITPSGGLATNTP